MNGSADSAPAAGGVTEPAERLRRLEAQTAALIEAVEVLARGLEGSPLAEPPDRHVEGAARRAHELMLLARSPAPGGEPGAGATGI